MELIITAAITTIIFTAVGMAIYQFTTVSGFGNDKLTAGHELQNSAYWFNMDGQTAVSATGGDNLVLLRPDGQSIVYSLSGGNLERRDGSSTITLAREISSIDFSVKERLVSMSIVASPAGRANVSEQGNFKVYLRPVPE
jgi:hypothetical protein